MMKKTVALSFIFFLYQAFIPEGYAGADCNEPIPDLFEKISPSVVLITAVKVDPFRVMDRIVTSIGSGFIIDKEGSILTNSHVVFGSNAIVVTLDNGQTIPAKIVGIDPILDLAVLHLLSDEKELITIPLMVDTEKVRVGEEVIAIGNPLGLNQTLTRGVVSAINRILPISPMSLTIPMIQTDAAINPGNSGGPLINRCGRVIGINTSVLVSADNIGFALPAEIIKAVLPDLIRNGRIIRPWMGIRGQLIQKEDIQSLFNLDVVDGFLIETIDPGSPADTAGLRSGILPIKVAGQELLFGGDIILSANGKALDSDAVYQGFVKSLKVGDTVKLTIYREGEKHKVEWLLPERPMLPGDTANDCATAFPYE